MLLLGRSSTAPSSVGRIDFTRAYRMRYVSAVTEVTPEAISVADRLNLTPSTSPLMSFNRMLNHPTAPCRVRQESGIEISS
jgi:hypothetical protein